eukprot:1468200-Rhodomonas_salina.1
MEPPRRATAPIASSMHPTSTSTNASIAPSPCAPSEAGSSSSIIAFIIPVSEMRASSTPPSIRAGAAPGPPLWMRCAKGERIAATACGVVKKRGSPSIYASEAISSPRCPAPRPPPRTRSVSRPYSLYSPVALASSHRTRWADADLHPLFFAFWARFDHELLCSCACLDGGVPAWTARAANWPSCPMMLRSNASTFASTTASSLAAPRASSAFSAPPASRSAAATLRKCHVRLTRISDSTPCTTALHA